MIQYYAMTTHACIRWLHASPDAPAVDVYANGSQLMANFTFGQLTEYACVSPGMYRLTVYPAGTTTGPLIDTTLNITMRMNATLAITGMLQNISLLVIPEPPVFLNYANALIRAVQLSPDVAGLDIAANGTVLFQNVGFGTTTDYASLVPGSYTIELRDPATGQALLSAPGVAVNPGKAYTAFVLGLAAGTPPLQLIVAVDANSFKR